MALAHLEAHLSLVSQKLAQIAKHAEKAKTATKALTEDDLLKLIGDAQGGKGVITQISERGGYLGGFLQSLIKLLMDQDKTHAVEAKRRALETERIIKQAFPGFSLTQFENLLHKVLNDRERVADPHASGGTAGTPSSSSRMQIHFVQNGKAVKVVDVLPDSGGSGKGGLPDGGASITDEWTKRTDLQARIAETQSAIEQAVLKHFPTDRIDELKKALDLLLQAQFGTRNPTSADAAKAFSARTAAQDLGDYLKLRGSQQDWLTIQHSLNGIIGH